MPLNLVLIFVGLAGLIGVGFGYFLRWIISLGQRGSMELEIKEMRLVAEEEAKKITTEAEKKADELIGEARRESKEREEKLKRDEERIIRKD